VNAICFETSLLALLLLLLLLQKDTPLPADDAADLLQLALNCTSHAPATAAVDRLPSQLEPDSARRLAVTAAARGHRVFAGVDLKKLPAVCQHIDAATDKILYEIHSVIGLRLLQQRLLQHIIDLCTDAAAVS
jgi:hypothetical protein